MGCWAFGSRVSTMVKAIGIRIPPANPCSPRITIMEPRSWVKAQAMEPRRGRGRPPVRSDEETLRLILDAASAEFRAAGYAGTGMSAVATRAGVSTKTLYRLVPTKEELFRLVIRDRVSRFMLSLDGLEDDGADLAAQLERLLIAFGNLVFDPDTIAVYRLVLGECSRFPEIGRTFYEDAITRTNRVMAEWLDRQCREGRIVLDDPARAAEMLRGMMAMEPQRTALLGQASPPDAAAIAERARACTKLFLSGCGA
jgi:AcrR family transcriptional regulator